MKKSQWYVAYSAARKKLRSARHDLVAYLNVWTSISSDVQNSVSKFRMPVSVKCANYICKRYGVKISYFDAK